MLLSCCGSTSGIRAFRIPQIHRVVSGNKKKLLYRKCRVIITATYSVDEIVVQN